MSKLIKEWIGGFLSRHQARYLPGDWPKGGNEESREFTRLWITAFATREVAEAEADAASLRLLATPPNFRREHIPAVLDAIEAIRRETGRGGPASTREAAEAASRDCEHCCGGGLVPVYRGQSLIPPSTVAYCVCTHGRFLRRNHAESATDVLRRIPDFADVHEGRSVWSRDMPDSGVGATSDAPAVKPRRPEGISRALQFLVGMIAVKPTPLRTILAGAEEFRIPRPTIFEAAEKLEVIKSTVDGEEVWDIEQRRNS